MRLLFVFAQMFPDRRFVDGPGAANSGWVDPGQKQGRGDARI